jgi:hypothetical protein
MSNSWKDYSWNVELTLEGISPLRRHLYFYAVLVLGTIAVNTLVRL